MKQTQRIGRLCVVLVGLVSSGAFGQEDLLRGPAVDQDGKGSIVRHTMAGKLEILEGRPEMAAFTAATGDATLYEQSVAIEIERTVELSMMLIDQIDLLRESTDASLAGDQKKASEIQAQLHGMFDPQRRHDPLTPALIELLDDQQRTEYFRVLDAYWEAWIDTTLKDRMGRDKPGVRERVRERLTERLFLQELGDAYDISLKQYRDSMEAIYTAVEPTDEQRGAIREIVIGYIKETRLDPSVEQRRGAMIEIYEMLDEDRQEKLFEFLLLIVVPDDG